jgi:protein-tyrosine-phosphatase
MAAALMARHAGGRVAVSSAGSAPAQELNCAVVDAMAEWGIDISAERPKALTDEVAQRADLIVTMGCGDSCPVVPGARYVDWELPDPASAALPEVRLIRDEIDRRIHVLIEELASTD